MRRLQVQEASERVAMDGHAFDRLARVLGTTGSRRSAISALVAASPLALLVDAAAKKRSGRNKRGNDRNKDKDKVKDQDKDKNKGKGRGKNNGKDKDRDKKGKGKDQGKQNGKDKDRTKAQAEDCWRPGACRPSKGSNVSRCNLAGSTAFRNLNCTGCNISRANLRGADLSGANLTKANLSGSCLVDANLTNAIIASNTNMFNVVYCRTKMPDGVTINNSGCDQGTACCNGCAQDCTTLADACNDGVCRGSDGVCIKQPKANGTGCNADNDSCTAGDSCQNGVCTPGAGVNCSSQDDDCNTGKCRSTDGQCFKDPKANGTACGQNRECQAGVCEDVTCGQPGGACQGAADCCTNRVPATCVGGECCVIEGAYCEEEGDCCAGLCEDNFCQGCLGLGSDCESASQCCQAGGETLCRDTTGFGEPNCCHPKGGTCSSNEDCCDGRACSSSGRCCEGENFLCDSNNDCCNGLECRGGVCRSNICRVAGEACPQGTTCCTGNGTCTGGTCCHQLGQACVESPRAGNPCCGNEVECGGRDGATCCISDFSGVFGGGTQCTSDDQCCSGHCNDTRNVCCRPQGAACTELGPFNFECCIYEGLTCSADRTGTCIPCRKPGESCSGSGSGSTCCVGASCENGVCQLFACGDNADPCQDSSTCCPGHFCTAGGACLRSCQALGESCGALSSIFPCCNGLECTDDARGTCVRRV